MRFVLGPPPDNPDFAPEHHGWRLVGVPGYWTLVTMGSVIGAFVCAGITLAWTQLPGPSASLRIDPGEFGLQGAVAVTLLILALVLTFFAALIVVHELLHAFTFPGFGMTPATFVGVWLSRLLPYADHHGPLPCWRFVVATIAPFVFLSLVPLIVSLITGAKSTIWMLVSVVNALASGGDLLIISVVLFQVPLGAVVQNKAWDTWWRPAAPVPETFVDPKS